ncbi:MAG: hypothetical protein MZU79_06990 [Anaerotruncus sp.]|nr:hypothetical protein [Anaerotruncus sp.]
MIWDSAIANHVLPASLYLSRRLRSWFGSSAFPAIGPDVTGYAQNIPASAPVGRLSGLGEARGPLLRGFCRADRGSPAPGRTGRKGT